MSRKRIDVEALLAWAYTAELPKLQEERVRTKVGRSAWDAITNLGVLGTRIDTSGGPGGAGWAGFDEPVVHPDAMQVALAVARLAEADMEMPEGVDLLGDLPWINDAERAYCHYSGWIIARAKGRQLSAMVVRRAQIGDDPIWQGHGEVKRQVMQAANGRDAWFRQLEREDSFGRPETIEVDGYDAVGHRPHAGAYRKTYLVPDPSLLVADRVDYQAWVLALGLITEELRGRLEAFDVSGSDAPLWPWEGEERRAAPRIVLSQKVSEKRSAA